MKKKITALFLIVITFICCSVPAFASTDPYEAILNEYNVKYNLELGYAPVTADISLEDYRSYVEELAISQRATLDYMNKRISESFYNDTQIMPRSTIYETRTVSKYNVESSVDSEKFTCTATYQRMSNPAANPTKSVTLASSASISKPSSLLYVNSCENVTWSTGLLDSGRVMYVNYKFDLVSYPTMSGSGGSIPIRNITVHCEWSYNS